MRKGLHAVVFIFTQNTLILHNMKETSYLKKREKSEEKKKHKPKYHAFFFSAQHGFLLAYIVCMPEIFCYPLARNDEVAHPNIVSIKKKRKCNRCSL